MCEQVQPYYYDYLQNALQEVAHLKWVVEHIEQCACCRDRIKELKSCLDAIEQTPAALDPRLQAKNLQGHFGWLNQPVTCRVVKPYLALQALPELEVSIPTPITVHLNHCQDCRRDLETLCSLNLSPGQLRQWALSVTDDSQIPPDGGEPADRTDLPDILHQLARRPDSSVVTTVKMQAPSDTPGNDIPECYADWPFHIEVHNQQPAVHLLDMPAHKAAVLIARNTATTVGRYAVRFSKPLAAAAVIMLVFGLLLRTGTAGGVGLQNIYDAFSQAQVIHIIQDAPTSSAPVQEFWISRPANAMILQQKNVLSMVDLNREQRVIKIASGNVSSAPLAHNEIPYLSEMIYTGCGLLPFARIEDMPGASDWTCVTGHIENPALPNAEVYELVWSSENRAGGESLHKWRCYLDVPTNLPLRVEQYAFDDMVGDYELETTMTVTYADQKAYNAVEAQVTQTP